MKPNTFFKVNSIEEIKQLYKDPNISTILSLESDLIDFKEGCKMFICDSSGDSYITSLTKKELILSKYIKVENPFTKQKYMKNLEQLKAEHKAMGETIAKLEKENEHDWSKPQYYKSINNNTIVYSTGIHDKDCFEAMCINRVNGFINKGEISDKWKKERFKPHKVNLNI